MTARKNRTRGKRSSAKAEGGGPPLDQLRTGMPALDSIVEIRQLRKGKKVYQLLVTNEVDEYEKSEKKTSRKKTS